MRRHNNYCFDSIVRLWLTTISVLLIAFASMPVHAGDAPIGTAFTYQGMLKHNGAPVNGSVALRFRMYTAEIGGTQVGNEVTIAGHVVEDGLLTADLDFVNSVGFYDGSARWIEIDVAIEEETPFETLSPRQRITASPAALGLVLPLSAEGNWNVPGVWIDNTAPIFGYGVVARASGWAIDGVSPYTDGVGVRGRGSGCGVLGEGLVIGSPGVLGRGYPHGVFGETVNFDGIGVYGLAPFTDSTGVQGYHELTGNYGKLGLVSYGVYGYAHTTGSDAVRGDHGPSGNYGILGQSGAGVIGRGNAGTIGIRAENFTSGGTAVYATSPNGKALHAVNAISGHAGYFEGFTYFSNNIGLGVLTPTVPIHHSSGAFLSHGGSWVNSSDANLKENMRPVDSSDILTKVAELPIHQWNYKVERDVNHIGPTAQDFHAAFGLGENDVTIGTVDADGVALAAIQALHAQIQQKDEQIAALAEQNAAFEARLAQLEALIASQESNSKGEDQ